jgi:hypothetical protein
MIQEIFQLQNPWRYQKKYSFKLKLRNILPILIDNLPHKKILGLIGSRQVGKSSLLFLLIQYLLEQSTPKEHIFYFNLDDLKLQELFNNLPDFINFVGADDIQKYILIDEIQRLNNPGLFLKELYDLNKNIKIIYSGSSQLEIKSKLKEHLVGRVRQFEIHRLSFDEYLEFVKPITKKEALDNYLLYGSYPGLVEEINTTEKKLCIKDIYQNYVEKDIVEFLKIDNVSAFNKCLALLANQIGSLLSIDSLSKSLAISRSETIKYISILEQTFIIKCLYPFHKNYKKEITKTPKIYFLDLGLRNFIINNFNHLTLRSDTGALFENFYLIQVLAHDYYNLSKINYWRTTNQTEVDFIIWDNIKTEAVEVKYLKSSSPKSFTTLKTFYPDISTKIITAQHFLK